MDLARGSEAEGLLQLLRHIWLPPLMAVNDSWLLHNLEISCLFTYGTRQYRIRVQKDDLHGKFSILLWFMPGLGYIHSISVPTVKKSCMITDFPGLSFLVLYEVTSDLENLMNLHMVRLWRQEFGARSDTEVPDPEISSSFVPIQYHSFSPECSFLLLDCTSYIIMGIYQIVGGV